MSTRMMQALVLTPMGDAFSHIRDVLGGILNSFSVQAVRLDQGVKSGGIWANEITDAIQEADLIVADVSYQNPNVLYELGFAHALRKPTLLSGISQIKLISLESDPLG